MKSNWKIALVVVLFSVVTHAYLSYNNYQLKFGAQSEKSICNISSTFNCDAVALSSYSEILTIPLALLGFFSNLALLFLIGACVIGASDNFQLNERFSLYLSSVIFAASVVMGAISFSLLKTYCLFCLLTYALSLVQLFFIYRGQSGKLKSLFADFSQLIDSSRWIGIILVLIPLGAAGANWAIRENYNADSQKWMLQEALDEWQNSPTYELSLDEGLKLRPELDAKAPVLVEFADFLCPHCMHAAPKVHSFADANTDMQLVFKPFPLDGKCNDFIPNKGDGLRCSLAAAAICGETLFKKGWKFHDWLFSRQEDWTVANFPVELEKFAKTEQVDFTSLKACVESDQTLELLKRSAKSGVDAKVKGTPSFYLNGKRVLYGQSPLILRYLLARSKGI